MAEKIGNGLGGKVNRVINKARQACSELNGSDLLNYGLIAIGAIGFETALVGKLLTPPEQIVANTGGVIASVAMLGGYAKMIYNDSRKS